MKRKLLAVAITSLMAFGGTAAVTAAAPGNGDNGHGMCTAYFSGSENGQEKKRDKGNAFIVFAESIGDYDGDDDVDTHDVALWCNDFEGGYGNPGSGNTPWFPEGSDEADDCENTVTNPDSSCDYSGGTGTGSNGGNGNGREKTEG